MALSINSNIAALTTHRSLALNDGSLTSSMEKLSSGLRINHASDDPTGISIADALRSNVSDLGRAEKNAQDGISLLNTADGALNEIGGMLQRMRELAVQSSNGTLTTSDRQASNSEVQQLLAQLDQISQFSAFNSVPLLQDPTGALTFTFQVGNTGSQTIVTSIPNVTTSALALTAVDTVTQADAQSALVSLDSAIAAVDTVRSQLGAVSNRLTYTINQISSTNQNLTAAESQIRDTDMAAEMTALTKTQVMQQAATAMLAQANARPQNILQLMK